MLPFTATTAHRQCLGFFPQDQVLQPLICEFWGFLCFLKVLKQSPLFIVSMALVNSETLLTWGTAGSLQKGFEQKGEGNKHFKPELRDGAKPISSTLACFSLSDLTQPLSRAEWTEPAPGCSQVVLTHFPGEPGMIAAMGREMCMDFGKRGKSLITHEISPSTLYAGFWCVYFMLSPSFLPSPVPALLN